MIPLRSIRSDDDGDDDVDDQRAQDDVSEPLTESSGDTPRAEAVRRLRLHNYQHSVWRYARGCAAVGGLIVAAMVVRAALFTDPAATAPLISANISDPASASNSSMVALSTKAGGQPESRGADVATPSRSLVGAAGLWSDCGTTGRWQPADACAWHPLLRKHGLGTRPATAVQRAAPWLVSDCVQARAARASQPSSARLCSSETRSRGRCAPARTAGPATALADRRANKHVA